MSPPAAAARSAVIPFALKGAPALIERLLPAQKLSAEAYKEQMAGQGKTLTALGSYWKGRKPLILAKACVLGCLLPVTDKPKRDLEIFEMLMGMDDLSFAARAKRRRKPKEIIAGLSLARIEDYFQVAPSGALPQSAPVDWSNPAYANVKVAWRSDLPERERRRLEARMLPAAPYRERVARSRRPEEVASVHDHIWENVNAHLGTGAYSLPELVEQLGVMRYGHRPRVADTFCGSGQIPFEAARLGCDVYASDLNPVACMLTWGAFHIVGSSPSERERLNRAQTALMENVQTEIDRLGIEADGLGWRARAFLYAVEARCPETGWRVPMMPSRVVSKTYRVIADLVPEPDRKRYGIVIRSGVTKEELRGAEEGTVGREGRYGEAFLVHKVNGKRYKTNITTLRGDVQQPDGTVVNRVRLWARDDFVPRPDDLLQERLYCIQWMRPKPGTKQSLEYDFRTVTEADLERERVVQRYVAEHLSEWQINGWVPDMRIEEGGPPRYQGRDLLRSRGWTHWQHLFNPRQLLLGALINRYSDARQKLALTRVLNSNCRISQWRNSARSREGVEGAFSNQALNTLFNYGCRGTRYALDLTRAGYRQFAVSGDVRSEVTCTPAGTITVPSDVFITDPPYGDAVKYEEILDFFIAWLRKNPPQEFADWIWDSRRALAIHGEDESFRRGMVSALPAHDQAHATAWHPDHHVHPPVGRDLGRHGEHRLGGRVAGYRRLVRRHRNRQRATGRKPCQRHGAPRLSQACGRPQDHTRRPSLGDSGGGRRPSTGSNRAQSRSARPIPRRERLRGRGHPDGWVRRGFACAHPLRPYRRARHGERGHPAARQEGEYLRRRTHRVRGQHREPIARTARHRGCALEEALGAQSASTSRCSTSRRAERRHSTTTRASPKPSRCATSTH